MRVLAPGTILQLLYLDERLEGLAPGQFIEIGAGAGDVTSLLLEHNWTGTVYDLELVTVEHLRERFVNEIAAGRLKVEHGNYLAAPGSRDADLIISCLVMEHLTEEDQANYLECSIKHLRHCGQLIGIVPAGMQHWGIEDEVAGHRRRYEREQMRALLLKHGWQMKHHAGLTYPISNFLLLLSNYLVRRAESHKLRLSELERTKLSGTRQVAYKTDFPESLSPLLNRVTMRPFHWMQKMFRRSNKAMILYFEAERAHG